MEQNIILNEKDIAQIIAKHYGCDLKDVEMQTQFCFEGYGPMERPVPRCRAKITTKMEEPTNA